MPTKGKTPTAPAPPPTCNICGKVLKTPAAIKAGAGKTCLHNAQLKTPAQWQAHYAKITRPTVPTGYVKLATFKPLVKSMVATIPGLTVTKVVNAIGRDKGAKPPAHPIAQPIYVNNVRYVNPYLATKAGLTCIATGQWAKAPQPKPV